MAFTYNKTLATKRDRLRFLIADTDAQDFLFEDEELDGLLALWPASVFFAAAAALDFVATDAAKLAVATKNDNQTTDPTKLPGILAERAQTLRSQAASDPDFQSDLLATIGEDSPDRVFTTTHRPDEIGSMEGW